MLSAYESVARIEGRRLAPFSARLLNHCHARLLVGPRVI